MPLQETISRECWSGDSEARLVPRSQLGSIQGNDKHTTVTFFWSGRFMFPNSSVGAIVPIAAAPVGPPRAAESERQATLHELMPYFLGYGKVELRWAAGTLEKYENAMSWVIRDLGAPALETKDDGVAAAVAPAPVVVAALDLAAEALRPVAEDSPRFCLPRV